MRRIQEIKQKKAQLGMRDAIKKLMKEKEEKEEKIRKRIKSKVLEMYEKQISITLSEEDKKFSRILLQVDRLHKIL